MADITAEQNSDNLRVDRQPPDELAAWRRAEAVEKIAYDRLRLAQIHTAGVQGNSTDDHQAALDELWAAYEAAARMRWAASLRVIESELGQAGQPPQPLDRLTHIGRSLTGTRRSVRQSD